MNANSGERVMKKYAVTVHGFGDGLVWAKNRTQAHYAVILHLRSINPGMTVPFTQPMQMTRLHGERGFYRPGVCRWREWGDEERETVTRISLVGSV